MTHRTAFLYLDSRFRGNEREGDLSALQRPLILVFLTGGAANINAVQRVPGDCDVFEFLEPACLLLAHCRLGFNRQMFFAHAELPFLTPRIKVNLFVDASDT